MAKIRSTLMLALFVALAFGGCVGDDEAEPAANTTSAPPTTPTTSAAAQPTPTKTQPPQVVALITVNGTHADMLNDSYEVPKGANVTFDASASYDPDGTDLSFTWDFGDNATSGEGVAMHAWTKPGNYSVTLEVVDGQGENASETFPMAVVLHRLPSGTFIRNETKTFTGTVTAGTQGPNGCGVANSVDTVRKDWILNATDNDTGTPLIVTNFTMIIKSQGATGVDLDYYFYDPAGKEVGHSAGFEPLDGKEKGFTKKGEFQPGKYQLVVRGCTGANMSFTVEMRAVVVAGP